MSESQVPRWGDGDTKSRIRPPPTTTGWLRTRTRWIQLLPPHGQASWAAGAPAASSPVDGPSIHMLVVHTGPVACLHVVVLDWSLTFSLYYR